jgi:MFS family permease
MAVDGRSDSVVSESSRRKILAVLLVTVSMSLIGISIINVALPSIKNSLAASDSDLQWVLAGYALTFGIVLVSAGRAGDVLGRGSLYIFGIAVFAASSVVAGLAVDVSVLNAARLAQGLGSGILSPQIIGMIQHHFRGQDRARAFGLYGSVVGLSMGIGPLIGGAIVAIAGELEGWRWTFFVNVPVSVVAIVLAIKWFPKPLYTRRSSLSESTTRTSSTRLDLDPVGIALLGIAILGILLPFVTKPVTLWTISMLPAGCGAIILWLYWERRYRRIGRTPIVDLDMFKSRRFTNGVTLATVYFFAITSIWVLVALYMLQELDRSPFEAGLIGLPSALGATLTARWTGRHVTRFGRRIVTAGIVIAMTGVLLSIVVIQLQANGLASEWWLLATLTLIGIAQGSVISPNQTLTLSDAPLHYAGSTGGILQTGQRIGSAIGLGVITAIAFWVRAEFGWPAAITVSFVAIALALAFCLGVAMRDMAQRKADGQ